MINELQTIEYQNLQNKIHTIRGLAVMLDRDLADLYGVETKRINEAVKNNQDKFLGDFYFELNDDEFDILRSKISTANFAKTRTNPKVFTEQGIYMLATILKSKVASQVTVSIIRVFANMRKLISQNIITYERFERIEQKLSLHDKNFDKLFEALEEKTKKPSEGIFFDGQIYDAYAFVNDLLKSVKDEVVLIDNYIGASLKDLGKKWFAFSKFEIEALEVLGKLK